MGFSVLIVVSVRFLFNPEGCLAFPIQQSPSYYILYSCNAIFIEMLCFFTTTKNAMIFYNNKNHEYSGLRKILRFFNAEKSNN